MINAPERTFELWRDHDAAAAVSMGIEPAPGDLDGLRRLFDNGVRRVDFTEPVDLRAERDAVATLALIRELTAHAIVVTWQIRLGREQEDWRSLLHLHPPAKVLGHRRADAIKERWQARFFLGQCIHRHGPGFVQVRDRRAARLVRITIDDPAYLAAIEPLSQGTPVTAIGAHILEDFLREGLVMRFGETALWLPYRVRRWPSPPLAV